MTWPPLDHDDGMLQESFGITMIPSYVPLEEIA
jgi:hypothetical protein